MTIVQLLKDIVSRGDPYDAGRVCHYCRRQEFADHHPDCTWSQAEEWLEKQGEIS